MRFAWHPAKHRANLRAHGIDFADAVVIFGGPTWERLDDRQDYGEDGGSRSDS
ncbi:MAG: BrnT family toxin [Acidobacteria bacterium]|nr:BrnT family toxin [Acidobacteriota bacterium]